MKSNRQYIAALVVLNDAGEKYLALNGKKNINTEFKKLLSDHFDFILLPKQFRYIEKIPVNTQGKVVLSEIKKIFEN